MSTDYESAQSFPRPTVSFIIPTLNRGKYVAEAVESCLRNASSSVEFEVVIVDSSSEDGSFENLEATYESDPRVHLLQNDRSSGPLKSWLEGVEAATGDYVTFVWSDDAISPRFLDALVPPLEAGAVLAYGLGKNADINSAMIFPDDIPAPEWNDRHFLLKHYYLAQSVPSVPIVVSPICGLFDSQIVRAWMGHVERFCHATTLRERVMWRSAIGPDLMLYLAALSPGSPEVAVVRTYTAKMSEHPGSISISSSKMILETGYWLAKVWYLAEFHGIERRGVVKGYWGGVFAMGCFLLLRSLLSSKTRPLSSGILGELTSLLGLAWRGGFLISGLSRAVVDVVRRVAFRMRKG